MKQKKVIFIAIQFFTIVLISCSCGEIVSCNFSKEQEATIKIMNWNLQTFFDSDFSGTEYKDYSRPSSYWNEQKYQQRLSRLEQVIKKLDADILILEELENENQLYDISNRINSTFNFAAIYDYGFFAKAEGSAIGCGVLSRFPLSEASVHSLDIHSGNEEQPSMRPIIQINATVSGKILTIFVNHWKSKSGGAEISDKWRDRQEEILAELMLSCGNRAMIAAGDFNRDISEFNIQFSGKNNVVLGKEHCFPVFSPWIKENGELLPDGSYYFQGEWEKIDHFFCSDSVRISSFYAEADGDWADFEGKPVRYNLWTGQGFSDHLPVTCTVKF